MAKKRKHDPKIAEPTEPPQKQLQQEPPKEEEPIVEEEFEEVEEEAEEEGQGEGEGEEEGENEEEEEEEGKSDEKDDDEEEEVEAYQKGDEDDEPIQSLLEPFNKDQLVNLLREAAEKHRDIATRVRQVANEDPVHRKIFVHGLGWDTKADTLIDVFKQYGEIEDCKAVVDKVSGKSKGYGFILFKTRTGARKALKEPQKKIGSRMTACQLASIGPAGTPAVASSTTHHQQQNHLQHQQHHQQSEYTQRKIFVSNVGSDLDPQKLLAFFSKYGEIEEGPLGIDKVTGKPKGFCLFVYKTADGARNALEEPHKNFEGHLLNCQKAIDGPKPGKSRHHNAQNPHFQRNDNVGYVGGAGPAAAGHGHLMAPSGPAIAPAAAQALNPAIGQALSALLATQGAGLGLNPAFGQALLGTLGSAAGGTAPVQGSYGNQINVNPGVMGGYGNQGGYPHQQMPQGGAGRGQHAAGQYGTHYMGH